MRFIRGRRSRDAADVGGRRRSRLHAWRVVAVLFAMALGHSAATSVTAGRTGLRCPTSNSISGTLHRHRGACRRSLLDLARPADRVFRQAAAEAGQRLRETRIHVRGGNLAWPSYRDQLLEDRVDLVGLNCATCHVGSIRNMPGAGRRFVVGMPANRWTCKATRAS